MPNAHSADKGQFADADRHIVKIRYAVLHLFKGRFDIVLDDLPHRAVKRRTNPAEEGAVLEIAELGGLKARGGLRPVGGV